ncbi:MAG: hypothetical protein AAF908_10075, partial [Pseudomonadota bacterium]
PRGTGPHKTVLYLYGSTGHSRDVTNRRFFQQIVDRFGYALVVPGALDINYRGGIRDTGWSLRHGQKTRDEVAFLRAVLADAEQRFGIDRDNVLVMGQSHGGFLIWELACHNPEIASAFAVHAGGYLGPLPRRCRRPVKFLHTHGVADRVVRFGGMEDVSGRTDMAPIRQALALLERTNNCDAAAREPTGRDGPFERYAWSGCDRGSALELMLHRGGHSYPGSWFQVVIDWFEAVNSGPRGFTPADPTRAGNSVRFKLVAPRQSTEPEANRGGRFIQVE